MPKPTLRLSDQELRDLCSAAASLLEIDVNFDPDLEEPEDRGYRLRLEDIIKRITEHLPPQES